MGTPIVKEYGAEKTILKFATDYKGAACVVPTTMGTVDSASGKTLVKAGTPFPSNDKDCLGYLMHTVDVTNGDAPGTYIYAGSILTPVLTANGITVSANAKGATPRVTFFEA